MRLIFLFICLPTIILAQSVIFNRAALPTNGEIVADTFLFFDASKAALRAPALTGASYWSPDSIGTYSIALGLNTKAKGLASSALGFQSQAIGATSVAIGSDSKALGYSSTAIGQFALSRGNYSISLGKSAHAYGENSTSIGISTKANNKNSVAMGNNARANALNAISIGTDNDAFGNFSTSIGQKTYSSSFGEVALGSFNTIVTPISANNWIVDDRLLVVGNGDPYGPENGRSDAMVLMKNGEVRFPDGSFLVGRDSMPKNGEVMFERMMFYDEPKSAFRGGFLSLSSDWSPDSIGINSLAYGHNTKAKGEASAAFGVSSKAIGVASFASGSSTASGDYSFSSGNSTQASGNYAFSSGFGSEASGDNASSFGVFSKARGNNSFAAGVHNIAESYAEFALGSYNTENVAISASLWNAEDRLFVLGNGLNTAERSDALVVLKNGNTTINGDVNISDVINLQSNGRLGIREISPDKEFHVKGQAKIEAFNSGSDANLYMQSGTGLEGRILTTQNNGNFLLGDIDNVGGNLFIKTGGSERISILDNGNVGIGIIGPQKELHVKGNFKIEARSIDANFFMQSINGNENRVIVLQDNNDDVFFGDIDGENRDVIFRSNGSDRIWIKNNGNVGIGNNAPSEKLSVVGNIIATGTINGMSDLRYKREITPITSSLSKVNQLNGYYYYWDRTSFPDKEFGEDRQIGVIAQEVEALFPEMVLTDSEGYKSVAYSRLTAVLIEAVKELSAKNEKLSKESKEEINQLRSELDEIRTLVSALVKKEN